MKKLVSMFLAVVMVFAIAVPVFAEEAGPLPASQQKGSITITGIQAESGITYDIYKILDLESYDKTTGAYSYKLNEKWAAFFAEEDVLKYVNVDNGYVTWKESADTNLAAAQAAEVSQLAIAYAKANHIDPEKSSKNGEMVVTDNKGKFSDLPLGYYLVDSTVGALCGLTTTFPDASIVAKNGIPTIDKQVKEDLTGLFGDSNTADIGQIVEFRTTINVHAGAENYVLHDEMSAGLTFQKVTKVEHVVSGAATHEAKVNEKYIVNTENLEDDCTFEVVFTKDFHKELKNNDKIIVYYTAVLNDKAVIAGAGNPNEAWLDYGEGNHTTHDTTVTKAFAIDIVKTDSNFKKIHGAEFKIYDAATGGNEIAVVFDETNNRYYRDATLETGATILVKDGQVRVEGLDNGTYYLEEVTAPDGYNKLSSRKEFIISDANWDAEFDNSNQIVTGTGVHVVNKTGTMLPETGGTGTILIIVIGGSVVLGAGVLLFVRKRMTQVGE